MEQSESLRSAWKFVIHVIVGGVQFLVLLLVAVAIAGTVKAIQYFGSPPQWLVQGCEVGERVVFWVDAVVYGLFILAEALKLLASLWWEVRGAWVR